MNRLAATNWIVLALWSLCLIMVVPWVFDRTPPFEVVGAKEPPATKAGNVVMIIKEVRRDTVGRNCSVEFARYLVDAKGAMHSYDAGYLSAENRRRMSAQVGPYVKTALEVPATAAAGRVTLYTDLTYVCNPIHSLWPIRVSDHISFEVLP